MRTPLVSAIGHETDAPLVDLVADLRASTPTDAAKHVVPDVGEEQARVDALRQRARRHVNAMLDRESAGLAALRSRPVLADPLQAVERRAAEVDTARQRAHRCLHGRLEHDAHGLEHLLARVRALSPAATLERGYAVVQRLDGAVVRNAAEVAGGDALRIRVARGELSVRVAPAS
jgi:exodeoxyribonuclease VII large subunit